MQRRADQTPSSTQYFFSRSYLSHRCRLKRGSLSSSCVIIRNNTFTCNSHKITYALSQNTIPVTYVSLYTYTPCTLQPPLCVLHLGQNNHTLRGFPNPFRMNSLPQFLYVFLFFFSFSTAQYTVHNTQVRPFVLCNHIAITRQNSCWKPTDTRFPFT